jgi:ABC-type transport system involved in cytochrome bd biosynthesis fused ATPase/permease subunit
MLSMVDGVEQLQTFFGQYIPQVAIAIAAPVAIFAFIAFWDPPVAADGLMEDRTTIVVANRLSTIRAADLILMLQAGRVIEAGRHAGLVARRGVYARLVERQVEGVAAVGY